MDTEVASAPTSRTPPPSPHPHPAPAEVLFPEARRRRRRRWLLALSVVLVAGGATAVTLTRGSPPVSGLAATVPAMATAQEPPGALAAACSGVTAGSLFALTDKGEVVRVNPSNGSIRGVLATGAAPGGGLALDPIDDMVYVTGRGPDGQPAVWALGCGVAPMVVAPDAELPSASPHGADLAYVDLTAGGGQAGVTVIRPGRQAQHVKVIRHLRLTTTHVPIRGLALGPRATTLAVAGAYDNRAAEPGSSAVGSLDPATSQSLATLAPVETPVEKFEPPPRGSLTSGGGSSVPSRGAPTVATYLPSGLLVVNGAGTERGFTPAGVAMPFTGVEKGYAAAGARGFLAVATETGRIASLSVGPTGSVALVTSGGSLQVARGAWDLPFGPWAFTGYGTPPPTRTVGSHYRAVAWTAGHASDAVTSPPPFPTAVTPTVVGQPEAQGAAEMTALGIPSLITQTEAQATAPPGTVIQQTPPGGHVDTCDCAITFVVTPGGNVVTASAPRGR